MVPPSLRSSLLVLATLLACACRSSGGSRPPGLDPTVMLATEGGGELGVSTPYGVVFLGHGQRSGEVDFTAWFRDGPSLETGLIVPLGDDLFVTHAEISLPTALLGFEAPPPGSEVLVRARTARGPLRTRARVASAPGVEGLLLEDAGALRDLTDRETGAGVYHHDGEHWRLVGLVAGRLRLGGPEGARSYLRVAGPETLWRLLIHARDLDRPQPLPKRGDVLP